MNYGTSAAYVTLFVQRDLSILPELCRHFVQKRTAPQQCIINDLIDTEARLRNELYCFEWDVKLYHNDTESMLLFSHFEHLLLQS